MRLVIVRLWSCCCLFTLSTLASVAEFSKGGISALGEGLQRTMTRDEITPLETACRQETMVFSTIDKCEMK